MAARPLWMAIVRRYTKTAGILSLAEYPLFYFTSRPERYRRARSKPWEADTWRTRSRPRPCWIFRTQVPSGAARAR